MKRWLGRLWRWTRPLVLLALLVLAAWAWLLPTLVERQIEHHLRAAGAGEVAVRVHRVGWSGLELGGLVVGAEERLSADAVSVGYQFGRLRHGHLDTLAISGAQLVLTLTEDGLEIGDLAGLALGGEPADDFPFDAIELHHSALLIETPTGLVRLPVQGLVTASANALTLGLVAEGLTQRARLTGRLTFTDAGWTTDNLRLRVRGSDTIVGEHTLRNLHGDFSLQAASNDQSTRLTLATGSRIEADRLNRDLRRPAVRVTEPIVLTDADGAWAIGGGTVAVSGHAERVDFAPARADRLAATARLALAGDADVLRFSLTDAAPVEIDNLRLADTAVTAEQWRLQPANEPLLTWHRRDASLSFAADLVADVLDAEPVRPATAAAEAEREAEADDAPAPAPAPPDWSAAADRLALRFAGTWQTNGEADAGPHLAGQLQLEDGRFEHHAAEAVAEGLHLDFPLSFGPADGETAPGSFTVDRLRWAGADLPGPTGEAKLTDGRVALAGRWQPIDPVHLAFTAEADPAAGSFHLAAEADRFEIVDPYLLRQTLPALADVEIDGAFAAEVELAWTGRSLEPRAVVTLDDVDLRSRTFDAQLRGIAGEITFNRLAAPLTPADQRLTVRRAELGQLQLDDGLIGFRLETPREILVERMRWTIGRQSQFRVHGFRFDLDQPEIETDIFVERMNLDDWLAVLTDEAVTGTGELYGRIPVSFRPHAPQRKLVIGGGFLYSKPGTGTLRVRDADTVDELLRGADPRFAADETGRQVRQQAVDALVDFEYSMVTFDFVETDDDDLTLRIETRGRGRRGSEPLEIGSLVINVNGFGHTVDQALIIGMTPQRAIDRTLDSFFERINP